MNIVKALKTITIAFLLLFSVTMVVSADEYPVTITDAMGREITIDKPFEKIASNGNSVCEALIINGDWDKVVARDSYSNDPVFYPHIDSIPIISSKNGLSDVNYEKIVELSPDVLLMHYSENMGEENLWNIVKTLEPDIPVIYLDFTNPDTFNENLVKLGKITGNTQGTERYLEYYTDIINKVKEKTSKLSDEMKPNVFMKAADFSPDDLYTYGKEQTSWNAMCNLCGGKSISSDVSGSYIEVDPEWLVSKDVNDIVVELYGQQMYPDTFGHTATNPSEKDTKAMKIISDYSSMDVFSQTDAVSEGNVFLIDSSLTYSPRFIIGIAYLAKWLHPELFEDLDPEELHQQYLTEFMGSPMKLDSVGIYAYP